MKVGILGATGVVGKQFVRLLNEHPEFEIVVVTTNTFEQATGTSYGEFVEWTHPEPLPPEIREIELTQPGADKIATKADLLFSAVSKTVAKQVEPRFAEDGCLVCSTAMNERLSEDVPLIVPEVNADHLQLLERQRDTRELDGGIIKTPSAPVVAASLPLSALAEYGLAKVMLSTMQGSTDGFGEPLPAVDIINNVVPEVSGEESKIRTEIKKVLGTFDGSVVQPHEIHLSPSCNLVPMQNGIFANMWVKTNENLNMMTAESEIQALPPVDLPSAPKRPVKLFLTSDRPQPQLDATAERGHQVAVGPVENTPSGVKFDCLTHSTIRGAAGTSILNAELLIEKGYL